jgi:hypothetical protein
MTCQLQAFGVVHGGADFAAAGHGHVTLAWQVAVADGPSDGRA